MNCRTTAAHRFRTKLGLKQHHVILIKEQSVLTKIKISCKGENIQTEYSVLGYRIDLYFHDYKLTIEIGDNGHSDRNIDYEIKRQKELSMKYLDTKNNRLKRL